MPDDERTEFSLCSPSRIATRRKEQALKVYVILEERPADDFGGDLTTIAGVYEHRADAMRRVSELFDAELESRDWDPERIDTEHPESFMDSTGAVVGDLAGEGWVVWQVFPKEVW